MDLLEQILSNKNMNEAYIRVYKNKGASGVDGVTVDELKQYLKENKDELRQRIRTRKYQPQAALRMEIPKENGKMRKLGIPTVVDRVVQQAIHQVLSPLLSNIMLNELDKELEKRGLRFVRYADDALIFVKSEKAANRVMSTIVRFIEEKLGLIVNVEKSRISRPKELKFLGFGYYYDTNNNNYKVKPHPSSVQKFQRKLRQLTKRNWNVPLDYRILKLNQVIVGWVNYFRVANMKKTTERIDTKLRSRIRVIIWKQWKVAKKQIKSLIQLGIPEEEAKGLTYCRKGYRFIGVSKVVQRAISNKRLKQRGVPSALEHYLKVHTVI
ncbi:reverse transcriptase domain-containing protein [Peribacillus simplex]|uniref:reverse transcriptase domain-containing protein n=1 Tax=Peribacillus simplex TaxID=1478 RepID=UPI00285336A6|nr:reverse transcriptase domain-containing protein [Peribacillus simplex]MDR4927730.1 reverse transcriptase domain-containing protein [Peribacillus simplex]